MREIKFRGLNQDGAWLYGSYVTDYKDFHAIITQHPFEDEIMMQTPVHKETVGQFTGLHDKNGVELYEGDKYKHHGEMETCDFNQIIYELLNCCIFDGGFEITGNIHETPELLEDLK